MGTEASVPAPIGVEGEKARWNLRTSGNKVHHRVDRRNFPQVHFISLSICLFQKAASSEFKFTFSGLVAI
jgi:hypothetical protein